MVGALGVVCAVNHVSDANRWSNPLKSSKMADSEFWRTLAVQFQGIPDFAGELRADWQYKVGSGGMGEWRFAGAPSDFVRSTFETLARRGSSEIAEADCTDLLAAWFDILRKEHINFQLSNSYLN